MANETTNSEASKPLSNAKHEKFAQGVADGMTQAKAYVGAGYKKSKTVAITANKLLKNTLINARVQFLKQSTADSLVYHRTHSAKAVWELMIEGIKAAQQANDHKAAAELVITMVKSAGLDDPLYTRKVIFGENVIVEGGVDPHTNPELPSNVTPLSLAIDARKKAQAAEKAITIGEALRRKKLGYDNPVGSDDPAA